MNTYKYAVCNANTDKEIAIYDLKSTAEMHKQNLKKWLSNVKWEVRRIKL